LIKTRLYNEQRVRLQRAWLMDCMTVVNTHRAPVIYLQGKV